MMRKSPLCSGSSHFKLSDSVMLLNPTNGLLYVASGNSHWFNVVDADTNKAVGVNTQISYPLASVADL